MPPRNQRPETARSDFAWQLGSALRDRREELGLSQEKLAERARISAKYLGQIERAQVNASLDTIERVMLALTPRRERRIAKTWTNDMIREFDTMQVSLTNIRTWFKSAARGERS